MPSLDFSTHGPEFGPEPVAHCERLVDGLRAISAEVVHPGGSLDDRTAAAEPPAKRRASPRGEAC